MVAIINWLIGLLNWFLNLFSESDIPEPPRLKWVWRDVDITPIMEPKERGSAVGVAAEIQIGEIHGNDQVKFMDSTINIYHGVDQKIWVYVAVIGRKNTKTGGLLIGWLNRTKGHFEQVPV